MKTVSEELKAIINQTKNLVSTGLVHQVDIDRYEALLKYTVSAGKYDGDDINVKYSDSFASIEDALDALKRFGRDYPWSRIELKDGDFIYEIEPVRIMRRDVTTGFYNRCSSEGEFEICFQEEEDSSKDELVKDCTFEIEDAISQLKSVFSHNDIKLTLSGFPLDIIRRMAEVQEFDEGDGLSNCDMLAMELDVGELCDLLRESAEHCGYC